MFKDVSMSSDELGFVLNKILRMLNDVDLQELPPIIYQLLLLSTKVAISTQRLHLVLVFCLIKLFICYIVKQQTFASFTNCQE